MCCNRCGQIAGGPPEPVLFYTKDKKNIIADGSAIHLPPLWLQPWKEIQPRGISARMETDWSERGPSVPIRNGQPSTRTPGIFLPFGGEIDTFFSLSSGSSVHLSGRAPPSTTRVRTRFRDRASSASTKLLSKTRPTRTRDCRSTFSRVTYETWSNRRSWRESIEFGIRRALERFFFFFLFICDLVLRLRISCIFFFLFFFFRNEVCIFQRTRMFLQFGSGFAD